MQKKHNQYDEVLYWPDFPNTNFHVYHANQVSYWYFYVTNQVISYWSRYRSKISCIGPRLTSVGPVTGPIRNHLINDNFTNFKTTCTKCIYIALLQPNMPVSCWFDLGVI